MSFKLIKSMRISIKLTLVYALIFLLILILLNISILCGVRYYLFNQVNIQIEDTKSLILNKITSQNEPLDLSDNEVFSDVPLKENIYIRIMGKDGKTLYVSRKFLLKIKALQDNIKSIEDKDRYIEDKDKHLEYQNATFESKEYGTIHVQIVKDMENEYNFMEILFVAMIIADTLGIIASIILGYMISKNMLKPIDYITKAAENISINNLKERIDVKGPDDELKRLANAFNKMIDGLQEAFDKQTEFVANASHELRTPISIIQGYANLLDRWGKDDKEALEKSIYAIKLETSNMAGLVENLLFLAKGDSGNQRIEKEEFWLNELIDEVIKESNIIEQSQSILSNRNDKVKVFADYKMIKQMLRIFIDNSIKFTPKDGEIIINSEINIQAVKIIVSDTGIGIAKDEFNNIFNRFYIVDKSRSKEKGGTGLGLSIAKWIVDMHEGNIDVESEVGNGTKIIVSLKLK